MKPDPLKPSTALLCKLGSIVVHLDEATDAHGHPFDVATLRDLMADPDVVRWRAAMDKLALLPKMRTAR